MVIGVIANAIMLSLQSGQQTVTHRAYATKQTVSEEREDRKIEKIATTESSSGSYATITTTYVYTFTTTYCEHDDSK
jgi:hypothetical protein